MDQRRELPFEHQIGETHDRNSKANGRAEQTRQAYANAACEAAQAGTAVILGDYRKPRPMIAATEAALITRSQGVKERRAMIGLRQKVLGRFHCDGKIY